MHVSISIPPGKVESVADRLLHSEQLKAVMKFRDSHDVAANSYHLYKEDVAKAKELKVNMWGANVKYFRNSIMSITFF